MLPVEWGVVSRTACLHGVSLRIEPKPEVIKPHGIGRHAYCCLRDDGRRVRKLNWRRHEANLDFFSVPLKIPDDLRAINKVTACKARAIAQPYLAAGT